MVDHLMDLPAKTRMIILAPLVVGRKGEHKDILEQIKKKGLVRVRIDGEIYEVDEAPSSIRKPNTRSKRLSTDWWQHPPLSHDSQTPRNCPAPRRWRCACNYRIKG